MILKNKNKNLQADFLHTALDFIRKTFNLPGSLGSFSCDCFATGNKGPHSPTDNICSGPPTEVMRARTMLWLLNHLICSALSRSVLSDTVAIHQSRHTHTCTHTHAVKDKNILHLSAPLTAKLLLTNQLFKAHAKVYS